MKTKGLWGRSSRTLALLLLAVTLLPATTLVWLGVRLLEQDRSLLAQRDFERRQAATHAAIHSLQFSLADAERHLLGDPVPEGTVRLRISANGIEAQPADRVLWVPVPRAAQQIENDQFADAERFEFQGSADRAIAMYANAARSQKPATRAGALLRVARVRRSQRRWDEALSAYRDLERSRDVTIEGAPADLQARRASGAILAQLGRTRDLADEAARLEADLVAGRWALDRPAWELTASEIEQWTSHPVPVAPERRLFSAVADALWTEREPGDQTRRLVRVENTPVTVLWRAQDAEVVALVISPAVLRGWTERAIADDVNDATRLSLLGASGELLAGPAPLSGSAAVTASISDTGLPWTLVLSPGDVSSATSELASRRRLLSAALAVILLLLVGGSYFVWRVMQRELAVARLQTDFVSAVSHEFRTPLTSLRHVTELLEENDDVPRERRQVFYEALGRNAERLHRLVESLLDFSRMEGGRKPYDLQPVDAAALAAEIVADFRKEVAPRSFTIDLEVERTADIQLRADAASLTNALWNLLDNAVKYSPDQRIIRVSVRRHPAGVAISVRDEGLGIPAHEQKAIFGRFVRGEKASRLGIKGTGLGLAMVSHIVEAHGGTIELESEEGVGSTFRLVLPASQWSAKTLAERHA
jgi:signal transduction histidine kinase